MDANLVELAWPAMRRGRQDAMLRGWLLALPDALIRRRPVLSVYYAWALLIVGECSDEAGGKGPINRTLGTTQLRVFDPPSLPHTGQQFEQ